MTKLMELGFTLMWITQGMKVNGLRTSSMEMELSSGLMEHPILESTPKAKSMERENSHGQMEVPLLVISTITTFMGQGFMSGLIRECSEENGETTRWKDMGLSLGLMGEDT